jgi:membrane-bound inhibitor of C-type lysozyme
MIIDRASMAMRLGRIRMGLNGRLARGLTVCCLAVFSVHPAALAAKITFEVPNVGEVQTTKAIYSCGNKQVSATYINAGSTSLVLLKLGNEFVVASNVLSGSGARYAGRQYVWWTKGDHADLYDLMKGEDAAPVSCTVKP